MWRALLSALVLMIAANASAQEIAPPELIESEVRYLATLQGPRAGTTRGLYIWRAPSTPGDVLLPTIYVADGDRGVYLVAARLRAPIEAGRMAPIQVIGLEPDANYREEEYGQIGRARYRAHERWVLETVIPWAERVARADPSRRAIGGFSNGADLAVNMAADHPDVFHAVLAHSPVATQRLRLDARAAHIRWAVSAGRIEMGGYAAASQSVIEIAVRGQGGTMRRCAGNWGHAYESWLDLTPGSVAWLFGFDADVASALEREACS